MKERQLRLEQIEDIEVMELEEQLGSSLVQIDRSSKATADRHGDFGLTAVVIALGPAALTALATWLEKKRVHSIEEAGIHVEMRPDKTLVIDLKSVKRKDSSEPPDPKTIQSLVADLHEQIDKAMVSVAEGNPGENANA